MCGFIVRGKKSILFCLIVVFLYHCFIDDQNSFLLKANCAYRIFLASTHMK